MGQTSITGAGILRETINILRYELGETLDELIVERVVIGIFFTGVKLNNGVGGVCFTPVKTIPEAVCCPSSARAMPASGKLKGRKATAFLEEMFSGNALKKALGIAVMNALSTTCWQNKPPQNYVIKKGRNALDEVAISKKTYTVVVGSLAPLIRELKKQSRPFCILELDPATLKPDEMEFYAPADQAHEIIPQADLLVITGTTLINDTLENLLRLARPGAEVIVLGPTASMLPDAFLRRGVGVLGGVIVTDPDALLDVISEAGSGYHFFGKSADRVVIQPINHGGTPDESPTGYPC